MAKKKVKEENLDPVYFLALDGNVRAAMEKLNSIDPKSLTSIEKLTREKYIERFGESAHPQHPTGPALMDELIGVYRSYWDLVLLQKLTAAEGYQHLFSKLIPIVKQLGGTAELFSEDEYDRVAELLGRKLKEAGYFSKIGMVQPHLNFMAWKRETTKEYIVDLGDGEFEKVNVVLMDDFISLGWAAYATFDKLHVGGWAEDNALYCVASSYDLESEDFRVSFLAHESRHFSDMRRYKNLTFADLEYRAKLNEIFLANESFVALLKKFLLEQRNNPANPHSFASFRLVNGLSEKLGERLDNPSLTAFDKQKIQKYAKELLAEDTQRLEKLRSGHSTQPTVTAIQ